MLIYKPRCWSRAKVRVNGRPICKRLLQKHETVPFTLVNVAALPGREPADVDDAPNLNDDDDEDV